MSDVFTITHTWIKAKITVPTGDTVVAPVMLLDVPTSGPEWLINAMRCLREFALTGQCPDCHVADPVARPFPSLDGFWAVESERGHAPDCSVSRFISETTAENP